MKQTTTPLSSYAIALRIGRTRKGVRDTILRLRLKPALELDSRRYYHPAVVEKIRAAMRTPNRRKES